MLPKLQVTDDLVAHVSGLVSAGLLRQEEVTAERGVSSCVSDSRDEPRPADTVSTLLLGATSAAART